MIQPISPLSLDRYELKYLIPYSMVEPISKFVELFCDMDYYSQVSNDRFYEINSLYLDTPSYYILRSSEYATGFRFNIRIRSYGTMPKPPYFFEVKYKQREFVSKKRGKVESDNWPQLFEPDADLSSYINNSGVRDFIKSVWTYNLSPVILTQYRRKAYISNVDDYARVTFDKDLVYQPMTDWCVKPDAKLLTSYDEPEMFKRPGQNVVLELKCEKKIPIWMIDLIKTFQLEQSGFSKFRYSMQMQQKSLGIFGEYSGLTTSF